MSMPPAPDTERLSKGAPRPTARLRRAGRISFQTPRVIFALFMREMNTTFGRSSLGYLWAVLEPIGAIAILTIAFSVMFRQPPLGMSFAMFYATGYLPFGIYAACQTRISTALRQNRALLFYPAVTYVDVIIARIILIVLTDITVALLVFTGLMLVLETGARPDVPMIAAAFGMGMLLGTGLGLMNATLFVLFPSWQNIWQVFSRPLFILSGVIYLFDRLPDTVQAILWWNPLIHVVGFARMGFYPEYIGSYVSPLYVVSFSLIAMAIGFVNLRSSNKFIIND